LTRPEERLLRMRAMKLLLLMSAAGSLHDGTGDCPSISFFIRKFYVK
jgi:hypothetical protein